MAGWRQEQLLCPPVGPFGRKQAPAAGEVPALALVPVYSSGDSFIYVRTVIVKEANMFFKKDTAVLAVDADGNVSWVREPVE